MGEICDDMIDGATCCLCGMFFEDGEDKDGNVNVFTHGCPVVCWDCWKGLSKRERREYQRALKPTIGAS
jgi:hypothetical protein